VKGATPLPLGVRQWITKGWCQLGIFPHTGQCFDTVDWVAGKASDP